MYVLALDEVQGPGEPRSTARTRLDEVLITPLDADEADEWKRDRWGLSAEQIALVEATEQIDIPTFGE